MHKFYIALLNCFIIIFVSVNVFCADVPEPRLGKDVTIKETGLKLRLLRDTMPQVVPALDKLQAKVAGNDVEIVDFQKAWRYNQTIGYFAGESAAVFVAIPKYRHDKPPKTLFSGAGYVAEKEFESWTEIPENKLEKPSGDISDWMTFFFGTTLSKSSLKFKTPRNVTIELYEPDDLKAGSIYVAKITDTSTTTVSIVAFEFHGASDHAKVERALTGALESVQIVKIQDKKSDPVANQKNIAPNTARSKNTVKTRSEKYEASRKSVIRNISSVPSWWYAETDNYILASNIKKKRDAQVIAEEAEKIRALFEKVMPAPVAVDDVSVIRVFDDRDEYNIYIGKDYEWTAGVWIPMKKELVFFYESDSKSKKQSRENVSNVLYHELFHQYCYYSSGLMSAAPWFNEGTAQVFQDVDFKSNGKFDFAADNSRMQARAKKILNSKYSRVENIINLNHESFNEERDYSYDATRLLMIFLLKHAPLRENLKPYSLIPQRYFTTLAESRNPRKAHEEAWKDVDMQKISKDFQEFLSNKSHLSRALGSPIIAPISTATTDK